MKVGVIVIKKHLEKEGENNGEHHIDLKPQVHGLLPHIKLVLMRLVTAVNSENLVLELRENTVCGEDLIFVHHAGVGCRVVED